MQEDDADADMPDAGAGQPDIIDGPAQPSDKPKITTRYMTKYERARVLGTRALQIRSVPTQPKQQGQLLQQPCNMFVMHVLLCSMNASAQSDLSIKTNFLQQSDVSVC